MFAFTSEYIMSEGEFVGAVIFEPVRQDFQACSGSTLIQAYAGQSHIRKAGSRPPRVGCRIAMLRQPLSSDGELPSACGK